jgi:hypothetical protein
MSAVSSTVLSTLLSVRQLTNSAGEVTDSYDYDAFGNLINQYVEELTEERGKRRDEALVKLKRKEGL